MHLLVDFPVEFQKVIIISKVTLISKIIFITEVTLIIDYFGFCQAGTYKNCNVENVFKISNFSYKCDNYEYIVLRSTIPG